MGKCEITRSAKQNFASSNSKQEAGKPHKQRTFRLLGWGVIPF